MNSKKLFLGFVTLISGVYLIIRIFNEYFTNPLVDGKGIYWTFNFNFFVFFAICECIILLSNLKSHKFILFILLLSNIIFIVSNSVIFFSSSMREIWQQGLLYQGFSGWIVLIQTSAVILLICNTYLYISNLKNKQLI